MWAYLGRSISRDSDENAEKVDPKEAKRRAKKERQEERGQRVKYVRK